MPAIVFIPNFACLVKCYGFTQPITHSKVTRFFFICNYISRIIEPLASRCAKFRFKPLSKEIMSYRISFICKEERLNLDAEALSTLSSISQGDLRRAVTYL